jgi:hypothetical protein
MVLAVAAVIIGAALIWKHATGVGGREGAEPSRSAAAPPPATPPSGSAESSPASSTPTASEFATWNMKGVAVYGNAATAPDGSNGATKLIEDNSVGIHTLTATININPAKPVSASLYARAGQDRRLLYFLASGGELKVQCDIDLDIGKATLKAEEPDPSANCETFREKDGWWRVHMRGTFDPELGKGTKILGIAPTVAPFRRAYEGNGSGYILIWAAAVAQ